jgi:hypothetical protein
MTQKGKRKVWEGGREGDEREGDRTEACGAAALRESPLQGLPQHWVNGAWVNYNTIDKRDTLFTREFSV